jgi:hypothetical protein
MAAMRHSGGDSGGASIYGCAEEGCGRLALQRCARCERLFCNDHVSPIERDLPTRGLQLPQPYWYCSSCLPRVR